VIALLNLASLGANPQSLDPPFYAVVWRKKLAADATYAPDAALDTAAPGGGLVLPPPRKPRRRRLPQARSRLPRPNRRCPQTSSTPWRGWRFSPFIRAVRAPGQPLMLLYLLMVPLSFSARLRAGRVPAGAEAARAKAGGHQKGHPRQEAPGAPRAHSPPAEAGRLSGETLSPKASL
jgi:hypothetical protein